jgi:hypothetical protein
MIPADLAFAVLINRTSDYYQANPPAYMTYTERTHVTAPSLGRAQDINRSVAVRVADNFAVMRDLPDGGARTGQAFPIIAYFDPLSAFQFSYFANLKRVDITIQRGKPLYLATPPPDPSVNVLVPYNSFWNSRYAADSTEAAIHLLVNPTPRVKGFYPSEVIEDGQTHLPSHIEMRVTGGDDESIALDYRVIDGHWVVTHGTFSATEHAVFLTFKVVADVTFSDITFPTEPPDPRLAGSALPSTSPSP